MKNKRWLYLLFPISALTLEMLPYGAALNFMLPSMTEGEPARRFRELYSYFDLMPFGYGNFAPLFTAVLTVITAILLAIYCVSGKTGLLRPIAVVSGIAVIVSLCPLCLGIHFYSAVGGLITLSLAAQWLACMKASKIK